MRNTVFYGGLNVLTSLLLVVLGIMITGRYFFSIHLLFIIPVGSFFIGYLSSFGICKGVVKDQIPNSVNNKLNGKIFFLSVVLAIVLVFGIYYITYLIAYVDKDMVVNYRLQGVHISQVLEKDINITSSFMRYIKYLIQRNNSTFVFSLSGYVVGQLSPSQGAQSMLGGIYFIADLIGFFVGFCFNIDGLKERKYCYSCGKYEKVMVSGKYALDNFNEAFQEFLVTGTFNLEQIKTYFYSKRNYVRMEIAYCPKCFKGEAEVGYFYKGLFRYERLVNEEEPCTEIDPEVIRKTVATFK